MNQGEDLLIFLNFTKYFGTHSTQMHLACQMCYTFGFGSIFLLCLQINFSKKSKRPRP